MHMFSVSFRELFEGISNFRSSKKQKEFVCCLFLAVVVLVVTGETVKPRTTQGRATYLQVGSSSAIVFRRGFWIIDRNGVPWMRIVSKKALWTKDDKGWSDGVL